MRTFRCGRVFTCVKHVGTLCKARQFDEALAAACSMDQHNIAVSREIIYSLLQGYASKKDLASTKKIQGLMIRNKLDKIPVLADHLMRLFVSCGCLQEAQQVFSKVSNPSVYTWNAILTAHCKLGNVEAAFELFDCMRQSGVKPDKITILCLLKACSRIGDVKTGRLIHEQVLRGKFGLDMVLASSLVDMYAKCGSLEDAHKIFNGLPTRDVVAWGAMLAGYAQHGNGFTALQLFNAMQVEGVTSNEVVFSSVLKACGAVAAIDTGQILHSQVIEAGFDLDFVVGSCMVDMYSKCRMLEDARKLFRSLSHRDSILWGTMVAGYCLCGEDQSALDTFNEMLQEDITPSKPMLLCVLKATGGLSGTLQGRALHDLLLRIGLEDDLILANAVIDMYTRCSLLDEAHKVFNGMQKRDIVSWTTLIAGYTEHKDCESVISLFLEMQEDGILPDQGVTLSILKACAGSGNIDQGRVIHKQIENWGLELDQTLCNALIDMYSKCGSLEEACIVFDELKRPDEVSWGAIISGYASCGNGQGTLELLKRMLDEGMELSKVVLLSSIKACSTARRVCEGRFLHDRVAESDLMPDLDIGSTLITMYAKCGCLEDATKVFNDLPNCDIVAWTSIIAAYAEHGEGTFAVELFEKMQENDIGLSESILLCIIKKCGGICNLTHGRLLHHQVLKCGLESSAQVTNLLISMYAKSGNLREAHKIFDTSEHRDEMSWGTIIAGFLHDGHDLMPFDLRQHEGLPFGKGILVCILKACSSAGLLEQGRLVHFLVLETGIEADVVIGNTLVHMYAKCESLHDSFGVFDRLPAQDLVTYSTMIARLLEADLYMLALQTFMKLQHEGLKADKHTYQCVLKVCGTLSLIMCGRRVHNEIVKDELDSDADVRSALVDMYANCTSLGEAKKVFSQVSSVDTKIWGAIIAGYTRQGDCKKALRSLEDMQKQGVNPTVRIFSSILSACSHAGMSDEGQQCFKSMTDSYSVLPGVEHLNCMIDLFSRAGHLEWAKDFLTALPICPDIVGRRTLLASCQKYGNTELGYQCFDQVVRTEPFCTSGLLLMSRDASRKDLQASTTSATGCKQARPALLETNTPGYNSGVGKTTDPQNDVEFMKVDRLRANNKTEGYTPQACVCVDKTQVDVCVDNLTDENKRDIWLPFDEKSNRFLTSSKFFKEGKVEQFPIA